MSVRRYEDEYDSITFHNQSRVEDEDRPDDGFYIKVVMEPTINPGDYMITDQESNPAVANILFSGSQEECEEWLIDNEDDYKLA